MIYDFCENSFLHMSPGFLQASWQFQFSAQQHEWWGKGASREVTRLWGHVTLACNFEQTTGIVVCRALVEMP